MLLPFLIVTAGVAPRPLFQPTSVEMAALYKRADGYNREAATKVGMLRLEPNWINGGTAFWYRRDRPGGESEYIRVETSTGTKSPLFDARRLADALSKEIGRPVNPNRLPLRGLKFANGTLNFDTDESGWELDAATYSLRRVARDSGPRQPRRRQSRNLAINDEPEPPTTEMVASPDGTWTASLEKGDIVVQRGNEPEVALTTDATENLYYSRLVWSPDSKRLIAIRTKAGDRKKVAMIQNAPPVWGPSRVITQYYNRPGDVIDTYDIVTVDPATKSFAVSDTIDYGDIPSFRPSKDGSRMTYSKVDRGYGRWRIQSLDPLSGRVSTLVDDDPATFVDTTSLVTEYLRGSDEILYTSERDGWRHFYLADGKGGSTQVTRGNWVVRSLVRVDEEKRQITFAASGMDPSEDPYFIHHYRIDFDGRNLVPLTPAKGTHTVTYAPDGETLVDTYSTVTDAPVHELRNAKTGALIAKIDEADVAPLIQSGWRPPQPFVAKGRDGRTDIWGMAFRPSHFDPKKRYPVIEDIYAGPHDSFVRKSFSATDYLQSIAELGFIVVKIDGMGTRNRSKAFHDVCYKNLADAGFPDRMLWMKALARKEPSMDLDRVGIFGTSAGGQSSSGGVLFHPEFYKVAVSSCGCHDNRLDKIWWNEQWMGKIGPHYVANSNIENAARLKGDLMLIVGELDSNVPPESTYRFAAALQAAGKEYELVVIPNSDHTAGGPYGERKRRDFFVRRLLGVEPPNPNRG